MNRFILYASTILLVIVASACGATTKTIMSKSRSERTDVFKEVRESVSASGGYADVFIKANIKTHLEGYYIGESRESRHGKSTYPFLINIDGQADVWDVPGILDKKPAYDENGKTSCDPEARDGMKYVLQRKIMLPAGKHTVFFGLAEDDYYTTAEIDLKEGASYVLEFKPIYRYKTFPTRIPSFFQGINQYDIVFNNIPAVK